METISHGLTASLSDTHLSAISALGASARLCLLAGLVLSFVGCPDSDISPVSDGGVDVAADLAADMDSPDDGVDVADVALGPADYTSAGPFSVGHQTVVWQDPARNRTLTVEIWYPAAGTSTTGTIEGFETTAPNSATLAGMLAAAPAGCVNPTTTGTRNAEPSTQTARWPLVTMSHCHNCTRFSTFSVAERLASHGVAVVAPDHEDNTLWDAQDGTAIELGGEFLLVRGGDMAFILDVLLDDAAASVPAELRGRFDADRVGVVGHSFGSITAGYAAQFDPRIKVVAGLAAPMENPLVAGVTMADIQVPLLFMVMREDNSISEFGNTFLRDNFANANSPAWKVEMADAGHWSVSDICGLVPDFEACCGDADRQTDGTPFTYLPIETGRAITQNTVMSFFAMHLLGDAGAEAVLTAPWPTDVDVEKR